MQAEPDTRTTMQAQINPNDLLAALAPVTTLVDEAKLHISNQGLHTKAVDPANVGMVELMLENTAFDSLNVATEENNGLILGVNLDTFTKQVKDISNEPVGDEEQTLFVELDEETRKLSMWAEPGSMEFTMALIDPDSIREEPDIPDMDLPGTVDLTSSYFDHAIKTANNYSEHITFGMNVDDETFYMAVNGDTDDWEAVLTADHNAVLSLATDADADHNSIFSLDYLNDMRKGIPNNTDISINVGDEFPVQMMFNFLDSEASVTYMVAPRIQNDD